MNIPFSSLIAAFLIVADQISKLSSDFFSENSGFINPTCNTNIAWGVPVKPALFYPLWFAIVFLLIKYFSRQKDRRTRLALVLILSGAASNMIDRAHEGCVIDFIDLHVWPVFNLADIYITIGAALLILKIRSTKHEVRNNI